MYPPNPTPLALSKAACAFTKNNAISSYKQSSIRTFNGSGLSVENALRLFDEEHHLRIPEVT